MKKAILGLVIAGAAGFGLLNYHFILLDGSVKILKKTNVRYENTFVDARGAKKMEIALKQDLVAAGIQNVLSEIDGAVKKTTVD